MEDTVNSIIFPTTVGLMLTAGGVFAICGAARIGQMIGNQILEYVLPISTGAGAIYVGTKAMELLYRHKDEW